MRALRTLGRYSVKASMLCEGPSFSVKELRARAISRLQPVFSMAMKPCRFSMKEYPQYMEALPLGPGYLPQHPRPDTFNCTDWYLPQSTNHLELAHVAWVSCIKHSKSLTATKPE